MIINRDIKIIEAILFASNEPVLEDDLKDKIREKNKLKEYLLNLKNFYLDRGINLVKTGSKWSFRTSGDLSDELTIFKKQKRRISRAALETLAIIAYQQPITRSEIENIRGVQMGRGSIDHLLEIGWIKPKGRKNIPGKPVLWATTDMFLEHFEIDDIANLPDKNELKVSGFLEKKSAITTISELAKNEDFNTINNENEDEENIDDFITEN
jgi:segregation and condensation protein B